MLYFSKLKVGEFPDRGLILSVFISKLKLNEWIQLFAESRVVRNKEVSESDSGLIEIHPKLFSKLLSIPAMSKWSWFYWMMFAWNYKKKELCIFDKMKLSSTTPGRDKECIQPTLAYCRRVTKKNKSDLNIEGIIKTIKRSTM